MADRDFEEEEEFNRQITRTLQKIDSNFSKAQEIASRLLLLVKKFHQCSDQSEEAVQVWNRFFSYFITQESKPEEDAATNPSSTPQSTNTSVNSDMSSSFLANALSPPLKTPFLPPHKSSASFISTESSVPTPSPPMCTPFFRPRGTPSAAISSAVTNDSFDASLDFKLGDRPTVEFTDGRTRRASSESSIDMTPTLRSPPATVEFLWSPQESAGRERPNPEMQLTYTEGIPQDPTPPPAKRPRLEHNSVFKKAQEEEEEEDSLLDSSGISDLAFSSPLKTVVLQEYGAHIEGLLTSEKSGKKRKREEIEGDSLLDDSSFLDDSSIDGEEFKELLQRFPAKK